MSFFIKPSTKQHRNKKRKLETIPQLKVNGKLKKNNDEILSSEDEDGVNEDFSSNHINGYMSEDENETPQEKRLRLAKVYLEEIERQEKSRLNNEDDLDQNVISQHLKDDYLKQTGKLKLSVADKYVGFEKTQIKQLRCREQKNVVTCLCLSSDNKFIFSGSKDGVVVKWSLIERKKVGYIPFVKKCDKEITGHSTAILSIAISSDNKFLVVGGISNTIYIWDPNTLKHIGVLNGHRGSITGLVFKMNSHTLYSSSKDQSVRVWSLDEMAFVETLFGHQNEITAIDVLQLEKPITSGGKDGTIRLWKIVEESQLIYNASPGNVDTIKMINEQNFVSGGDDGQLCVWSTMKKKCLLSVKNAHGIDPTNLQPYWISAVTALGNTDLIASGSQDGYIRLWKLGDNFRSINLLFEIEVVGFINSLTFTSDGNFLIVGCGKEHKFGRWSTVKSAVNGILIIPLLKQK